MFFLKELIWPQGSLVGGLTDFRHTEGTPDSETVESVSDQWMWWDIESWKLKVYVYEKLN